MDTDFHLRGGGRLTREPPSTAEQAEEFTYDPMDPVPTTGGALLMTDDFRPGPLDQTAVEAREDVQVFTTEPLAEDLEVTCPGSATAGAGPAGSKTSPMCPVTVTSLADLRKVSPASVDEAVRAAFPARA
ncbi:hypothetical protein QFZ66_007707 [Streptomyces sp. B4I13]|uniref:hypothetical protein n=1 Tax=Streptomyces sp. B4I13 TaxID=3042271 RepID=UPI002786AB17|nr:hypothetical protein [Streptomyces sp. B4I13]MDQ0963829.1 hypothetical protein [Streptomyces sp. B4I13]